MCTINTVPTCSIREFIFSLRNYPHLIDSNLPTIWVAYFGEELLTEKKDGVWLFNNEEKYKYSLILRAYHYMQFDKFDFVKNGDGKLREKMNSIRKL